MELTDGNQPSLHQALAFLEGCAKVALMSTAEDSCHSQTPLRTLVRTYAHRYRMQVINLRPVGHVVQHTLIIYIAWYVKGSHARFP